MKHMNERRYAVAVDGPSGAGKSTLAKAAAERLGILYVDTGAIYRTIGLVSSVTRVSRVSLSEVTGVMVFMISWVSTRISLIQESTS